MAEVRVRVRCDVRLQFGPVATFRANPLTPGANREEPFESPDFCQCLLQFLQSRLELMLHSLLFCYIHGMAHNVGRTTVFTDEQIAIKPDVLGSVARNNQHGT